MHRSGRVTHLDPSVRLDPALVSPATLTARALARHRGTVDGFEDRPPGELAPSPEELGNHLVLEVAPGEFLFLANLRRYLAGEPLQNVVDKRLGFVPPPR